MAESKVTGIIKSLNALEDDLDSLNDKVSDMKKQLSVKAQRQNLQKLLKKVRLNYLRSNQTLMLISIKQ